MLATFVKNLNAHQNRDGQSTNNACLQAQSDVFTSTYARATSSSQAVWLSAAMHAYQCLCYLLSLFHFFVLAYILSLPISLIDSFACGLSVRCHCQLYNSYSNIDALASLYS